ncbi:Cubilin isoform 2 [Schistosoma japonicum]|uniref:Cubilin isoform 2 n=1 Tax=Schistosoma japonicum TaxID=6182 RepID=A0A4Z2DQN3_SCHJA|nr:Cubilin isoform 2 [Schistosoma japonicum]
MILLFLFMIINIMVAIKSNKLSDPNCRCFIFDSTMHKSGIFKTPNYPKNYQYELDCLLYHFHGQPTELVKITFSTFNLRKPIEKKCIDYLDMFTTIDYNDYNTMSYISEGIKLPLKPEQTLKNLSTNFARPADYRLCGDLNDFPQNDFYSISSILLLIFHTASKIPGTKRGQQMGFIGQFSFDLKSNYQVNGRHKEKTFCDYEFFNRKLLNGTIKHGNFFSPLYPSNYPPNIKCRFIFKADKNERIILTFRSIRLKPMLNDDSKSNVERCDTKKSIPAQNDFISISEIHEDKSRTLAYLCTNLVNIQLVSHSSILKVDFISHNPIYQGQGFHGTYEFVHESQVLPSPFIEEDHLVDTSELEEKHKNSKDHLENSEALLNANKSKLLFADAGFTSVRNMQFSEVEDSSYSDFMNTQYSHQFSNEIKSRYVHRKLIVSKGPINHTEGIIHSPNFPEIYPPSTIAMYTFIGQPTEKVLVKFLFLELGNSDSCTNQNKSMGDRIQLFDGMHTDDPLILEYCENIVVFNNQQNMYTTSKPEYIFSSGNFMVLRFTSDQISRPNELGFKLFYTFEQQNENQQQIYDNEKDIQLISQTRVIQHKLINCSKFTLITEISLILPIIICFQMKDNR